MILLDITKVIHPNSSVSWWVSTSSGWYVNGKPSCVQTQQRNYEGMLLLY